jgi:hypothetical protein
MVVVFLRCVDKRLSNLTENSLLVACVLRRSYHRKNEVFLLVTQEQIISLRLSNYLFMDRDQHNKRPCAEVWDRHLHSLSFVGGNCNFRAQNYRTENH